MEYVTPQKVHESLENYFDELIDKLDDMEISDEEVRETTRVILTGSLAHLHFMFDNLLFHPLYGDFTRTDPINMQDAFRLSCIGFFVSSYDETNLSTMLLLDDVFEVLGTVIGFNKKVASDFVRSQLEAEKKSLESDDEEDEYSLSLLLSTIDLHICGYEDSNSHSRLFRTSDQKENAKVRARIMRTSLMGYREFYKTLSRESGNDDEV